MTSAKINQRPVVDAGTAILRPSEQLQLTTATGPITIQTLFVGGPRTVRWTEATQTMELFDFSEAAGDNTEYAPEHGKWSLRLAVNRLGEFGTPDCRWVIHWQLT